MVRILSVGTLSGLYWRRFGTVMPCFGLFIACRPRSKFSLPAEDAVVLHVSCLPVESLFRALPTLRFEEASVTNIFCNHLNSTLIRRGWRCRHFSRMKCQQHYGYCLEWSASEISAWFRAGYNLYPPHQVPCDSVQRRLLSIKMGVFMDRVCKNQLLSTEKAVFMDKAIKSRGLSTKTGVFVDKMEVFRLTVSKMERVVIR